MNVYIDASVILRVILGEPNPLPEWGSLAPMSSELVRVECLRVIDRAKLQLRVPDEQSAGHRARALLALATFRLVGLSPWILDRASNPFPTALGTLDAIHLATALELRDEVSDLALATHDRELAIAAQAVGFAVLGA